MLRYYKKHIFTLKEMLNELDPTSSNLDHVVNIQRYILKLILHTEKKITNKKEELKELKATLRTKSSSKEKSKNIKTKCSGLQKSIDDYYFLLYVWRCFGDGIAFKYLSKWNLKRLMFNSDNPDIKQSSGSIGGKKGIDSEFALLLEAKANGVPALLCDLTNTIRHGDVCLLGANAPLRH
jgi:predicted RNase H-like nuclease (RuvC/YqgF family)